MLKLNRKEKERRDNGEPNIAPGMQNDELERAATEEERREGETTEVTKLYLDRTPED
ncbi:hypothetical protein [Paenibacillus alkalitolerans]|uniref:hypothetical protein n=1 Tax=Paenibacillus alkalitolerans TaxID=2799335 RepID=UPI0018F29E66|nr:hypothetical protein [Paenibacillus alkalitolerans]